MVWSGFIGFVFGAFQRFEIGFPLKKMLRRSLFSLARAAELPANRYRVPCAAYNSAAQAFGLRDLPPPAKYGGRHTVTLLPGDGIGPELIGYVKEIFRIMGAPVDFETITVDPNAEDAEHWETALISVIRNGVGLKGNIETRNNDPKVKSRNADLRTRLDLFANVVRVKSIEGIRSRHQGVDVAIIRENTEGEYSQIEHENVRGVVESLKVITYDKARRIAQFAFEFAIENRRKKVTCVHKANIQKLSDGLFLDCCKNVAKDYPDIKFEAMIVDNCSMQMVSNPQQFDVLVLPNLYGSILVNVACGVIGGPGLASGANIGEGLAVFETGARNTGKSIMGQNIANPCAMMRAGADMLAYLGLTKYGVSLHNAINRTILEDKIWTPDLGGNYKTTDVVQQIINHVKEESDVSE